MNYFIKKLIYFILFTIVIYAILLLFFGSTYFNSNYRPNLRYIRGGNGYMNTRLKEVVDYKNVDVLFLGSSHTYRGFDTRIFKSNNIKGFNLGSSNQTHIQTNLLLKRYLKNLNPKIIIYEVFPNIFSNDGVESALDIISNDKNDINSFEMALKIGNLKVYNTLFYTFLREQLNLNSPFFEQEKKGVDNYISGGYVERNNQYFKYTNFSNSKWILKDKQLIEFEKNIKIINEKNIKLILVFAPMTSAVYNSKTNVRTFDSIMNKNGEYYNFNEIIKLDDSLHFYDTHHLNQRGVDLFNNKLVEIVKDKL